MNISWSKVCLLILVLIISLVPQRGGSHAQEEEPSGPVYLVQDGDTLWEIAQRFGVPLEELARENDISDPSQLSAGDELVIPGIDSTDGLLVTTQVRLGENIRSLSRRFQVPKESIIRLNHITSPAELFNGYNLVILQDNLDDAPKERLAVAQGQSLIELALTKDVNPWAIVNSNGVSGTWGIVPGDVLHVSNQESLDGPGSLPGEITSLELTPEPLTQGKTTLLRMEASEELDVDGTLIENELHFFQHGEGEYVALQGVHTLTEPGLYPLSVEGKLDSGIPFGFSQMVFVTPGDYIFSSLVVPEETIDPANTKPEDEIWNALPELANPERLWEGVFQSPVAPSPCGFTDYFGNRRSYNGSPYNYFHSGLDFCYNYNNEVNEIFAPADGVVVFAEELVVRGNAVMIDHGWGVYTGYMHQEEILVEVGDKVKTGQVIGIVGATGRVNGPHLHLEVWAGNVQVDPIDWLERAYP
jgi:murein DD-endopeptidase MepM/ murein hydrolase activator NlpD